MTRPLLFSISLLGKPPHSSIMSMATGKNLQSIPKKVSEAEPVSLGLAQGLTVRKGLGLGEESSQDGVSVTVSPPRGEVGTELGKSLAGWAALPAP